MCDSFLLNGKVALLYELIAVFRQPVCNSVCEPVVHCHYILSVPCLHATVEHHIPLLVPNYIVLLMWVSLCEQLAHSFDNESDTETAMSEL